MLTLRTLKELIDTPKRGEKLPTPKQLRTGESPVVAHKITGAGVNEVHIIVYQSGYAVYGIGNRATVFPVNLELGYGYSSVTEKKRKEDEKYNTWNPETGLREKKYFCELEESFFEKEEWYLRLMLIGEDRLATGADDFVHQAGVTVFFSLIVHIPAIAEIVGFIDHDQVVGAPVQFTQVDLAGKSFVPA